MRVLWFIAALAAWPAFGQEAAPINDVFAEIAGRQVLLSGRIENTGSSSGYTVTAEDGLYWVDFAVDTETMRRIRACPVGWNPPNPCNVEAEGELRFDRGMPGVTLTHIQFLD